VPVLLNVNAFPRLNIEAFQDGVAPPPPAKLKLFPVIVSLVFVPEASEKC